jgi:hypothetical protein
MSVGRTVKLNMMYELPVRSELLEAGRAAEAAANDGCLDDATMHPSGQHQSAESDE